MTPPGPPRAIGFITVRKDRPERLAFYLADGSLNTTFARDQTLADARAILADAGFMVDAEGRALAR